MAPTREADGKAEYAELCTLYALNIIERVQKQADKNLHDEPKNQYDLNVLGSPEHEELWKMVITPAMVKTYAQVLAKYKLDGEIVELESCEVLMEFLNGLVDAQYDLENRLHLTPRKVVDILQKPLLNDDDKKEKFQLSEDFPGSVMIMVHIKIPSIDDLYWLMDFIPDLTSSNTSSGKTSRRKPKGNDKVATYFTSSIDDMFVPKIVRGRNDYRWIQDARMHCKWRRADNATWECRFMMRELRVDSNEYLQYRMIPLEILQTIDSNDDAWRNKYKKYGTR